MTLVCFVALGVVIQMPNTNWYILAHPSCPSRNSMGCRALSSTLQEAAITSVHRGAKKTFLSVTGHSKQRPNWISPSPISVDLVPTKGYYAQTTAQSSFHGSIRPWSNVPSMSKYFYPGLWTHKSWSFGLPRPPIPCQASSSSTAMYLWKLDHWCPEHARVCREWDTVTFRCWERITAVYIYIYIIRTYFCWNRLEAIAIKGWRLSLVRWRPCQLAIECVYKHI